MISSFPIYPCKNTHLIDGPWDIEILNSTIVVPSNQNGKELLTSDHF